MAWPAHLAQDVHFHQPAAAAAGAALRRLATAIDRHAVERARDLAGAAHFVGGSRVTTDRLTAHQAAHAADLVRRLRAEADRIEADADAARHAARALDRARTAWLADQRSQW